ncbi:hypothetical protein C2S51_024244 [Perilla frutescens var. frutescens]|nr:hypothetical protein C2S51_024244 [Perilla frutescens var. frutescens]
MDKLEQQDHALISASSSSSSSSSTQFLSSWDSSSSGLSSPPYSDLGSSEGDDTDFIAELTRQMAECMLQEEETAVADHVCESNAGESYENPGAVNSLKSGFYSSPHDPTTPNIQVYELKNQPPVSKEGLNRGRRVRRTESAQQKQMQKTEQQYKQQYRGREWGVGVGRNGYSGSGMKAVFLGGSGPRTGSGTGVFLPRDPTELKNKSGCAMVLMPTRVLEVLEQHFNKIQQDSNAPPLSGASTKDEDESTFPNGSRDESPESGEPEIRPEDEDEDEMQLPQEWTY